MYKLTITRGLLIFHEINNIMRFLKQLLLLLNVAAMALPVLLNAKAFSFSYVNIMIMENGLEKERQMNRNASLKRERVGENCNVTLPSWNLVKRSKYLFVCA